VTVTTASCKLPITVTKAVIISLDLVKVVFLDRRAAVVGLVAIIAVLAFVLASNPTGWFALPQQQSAEPVKIGFIVSQTGTQAVGGMESLKGLLLAEKEINALGGINGKNLDIIIEDDKSSEKDAVSAFRKLVDVDGVRIVIGGQISGAALAVAPLAEKEKVLFLTTTATANKLKDAGDYVFMFQAGNEAHAAKISNAMKKLGFSKIGLVYANEEYCVDYVNYLKSGIDSKGIAVVAEEKYETASADARTQLLKLNDASPEAFFLCGYYEDQGKVLKQARELGIEKQFFAVTTIENPKFLEIAGGAAEGIIYTSTLFGCEIQKEFCESYEKDFNEKATYRSAYLYDAVFAIAEALKISGNNPDLLKKGLLKVEFNGVSDQIVFDEKGNTKREFMLKTVKNGKFVPFEQANSVQ